MPPPVPQRFLLDTNIVIALFAQEASVLQPVQQAAEVLVPCIVLGELYYGARKSGRAEANVQRVDASAAQSHVLACDVQTGRHYGTIRNALHLKGRPIPENDIWIAALALQHSLVLVPRDAHFNEIAGLSIVLW